MERLYNPSDSGFNYHHHSVVAFLRILRHKQIYRCICDLTVISMATTYDFMGSFHVSNAAEINETPDSAEGSHRLISYKLSIK